MFFIFEQKNYCLPQNDGMSINFICPYISPSLSVISYVNHDLFINGCIESLECECGDQKENVRHFLLHCPIFNAPRMIMINNVNALVTFSHAPSPTTTW